MGDDRQTHALIAAMRDQELAAAEERTNFYSWTERDVEKVFDADNAEVQRLTSPPKADPEIERLARIAAEESPKT